MLAEMPDQISDKMSVGVGHSKAVFCWDIENQGQVHTGFGLFRVGGAVTMVALQEIDNHIWCTKSFWELFLHSLL